MDIPQDSPMGGYDLPNPGQHGLTAPPVLAQQKCLSWFCRSSVILGSYFTTLRLGLICLEEDGSTSPPGPAEPLTSECVQYTKLHRAGTRRQPDFLLHHVYLSVNTESVFLTLSVTAKGCLLQS